MFNKFDRNYVLKVASFVDGPLDIEVSLPITIEFDITRNTLASANVCQLRIYNLSQITRDKLRFNQMDFAKFRKLVFAAGYGSQNLPIVFSGNITQAWSVREGNNFITQIECLDGGFAYTNGVIDLNFPAKTPLKEVMITMGSELPNTSLGAIGNYETVLSRSSSFSGNIMSHLSVLSGNGAFIDNGKINIISTNEYIQSFKGPVIINAQSGLLGTPLRERTTVTFDMLFEPGLEAGQIIELVSLTDANFNGTYQIKGIKHRGMISGAVCGDAITSGIFFHNQRLSPVVPLS